MKLPFSIDRHYKTALTKIQVIEEINGLNAQKQTWRLRRDTFIIQTTEKGFTVVRSTDGVDFFTLEQYPPVEAIYFSDHPLIINIQIKPNYSTILFFSIFVFTFIPVGIFVDQLTINDVLRAPTLLERFLFAGLGGVVPGLWCYFGYIRPVRKANQWIVQKLRLSITTYYNS